MTNVKICYFSTIYVYKSLKVLDRSPGLLTCQKIEYRRVIPRAEDAIMPEIRRFPNTSDRSFSFETACLRTISKYFVILQKFLAKYKTNNDLFCIFIN